jgi:hypothetical protein
MYEAQDGDDESRKKRRIPNSRLRVPRATRSTRHRTKSTGSGFGGTHRRRNKHWNW